MVSKYNDFCSFCGRNKSEVDVLIAGDIASICNECAQQALDYTKEAMASKRKGKNADAKGKPANSLMKPKGHTKYVIQLPIITIICKEIDSYVNSLNNT